KTWGGDVVASALAMFLFLKKLDKNVNIVSEKFNGGRILSFLPAFGEIKGSLENLRKFIISLDITDTKVSQIKYKMEESALNFIVSPKDGFFTEEDITAHSSGFKYDLIIVIGSPDLESLGKIYDNDTEFFYKIPIINIDRNSNNEEFGQINYTDLTAVAVGEVLFSLFESYSRDLIDEDIATCLLAGMIHETKSFKTPNITPKALLSASQLISMGARREEIVNHLYRSRPLSALKLWGRVLARLSSSMDNKLIWSALSAVDFEKTCSNEKDLPDVIDELIINIPQANIIVIFYEKILEEKMRETQKAKTNILVYSVKNINSLNIIKEYNPQGAKNLAFASVDMPAQDAKEKIIKSIEEKLSKLPI
ncbi:hypothetical protein KAU19_02050, partial [Candidatus Parcubacteria bacterium]|nr:hypothetical protein [Candidatus Parcubacteria bacterium]